MAFDLVAEFDSLVEAFGRAGIEFAVCGGIAVAIYGHPRFTSDIDFLVRPEDLDAARVTARSVGFDVPARKTVFGLAAGKPHEMQRVSKLDDATGEMLSLDLLLVAPVLEPVWAARREMMLRGRKLWIVSREGLLLMKRLAARPKDLQDIAALEGSDDEEA